MITLVVGFIVMGWILKSRDKGGNSESMLMLQGQLKEISSTLDSKLSESNKMAREVMQKQFGSSAKIIADVTEKLTKLDETNKQVLNFSDQLRKLQDILKNPKQRGVFGEYYLETLLKNTFSPNQYQMQYKFKDGEIVDAALFFGNKIIPIDSKFSLENYNRITEESDVNVRENLEKEFKNDLKKRIDETAKYIRPDEGTMEFALMFIPAEGIYYDLLVNKIGALKVNTRDLLDYAVNQKKVHVVSPNTFYAMLQTIVAGMKAYQIQESTKEILKNISQLERHLKSFADSHKKIGTHLSTTVNAYNISQGEFKKIDKDVLKLEGKGVGFEVEQIGKPNIEE